MLQLKTIRLVGIFILSVTCSYAASITGKVVGVSDGDTLTLLTPRKEPVKVRLHGVDAPESKQAFGARAKEELSSLVFGKEVTVEVVEKDRYGRSVGRVAVGGIAVNVELVRRGYGWWYRDYAKKSVELAKAEAEARNEKRGLWVDKAPVPPWEFRRTEAADRAKAKAAR